MTHTAAPTQTAISNRFVFGITTALRNKWAARGKCGVSINFAAVFTHAVVIIGLQSV
jgi:hypothetical protein